MKSLNEIWSWLIVEELVRNGVTDFCIAPGSRSTPLAVAACHHRKTKTLIHLDERGLGFYALGKAAVTKHPAVLICTSGTAAANFLPAVIETSKKKLPLILLTADRPPELRDTGALQTIDQTKLYGNYTRWFHELPAPDPAIKPEVLLTTMDQAVFRAKNPMPGPVHLNCMFREPLAPTDTGFDTDHYLKNIEHWKEKGKPYTRYTAGTVRTDMSGDTELFSILENSKRGLIIVGKLGSREEQDKVLLLGEKTGWPILPDVVSGLRMRSNKSVIHYYDHLLLSEKLKSQLKVDTVLHLGGRITSKRWYQYMEKYKPENYITVLGHSLRNDPLHGVTLRIKSTVGDFVDSLLNQLTKPVGTEQAELTEILQKTSYAADRMITQFLEKEAQIDEPATARIISQNLSDDDGLFLSNSMPVRDMDMYAAVTNNSPFIGGNRGGSGIDGIIASACGFCEALRKRTTLLIGDVAALHDLNSLALVNKLHYPLILVVVNNDGGGIFSFLPVAHNIDTADIFHDVFATRHGLDFRQAAAMFSIRYETPATTGCFERVYKEALAGNQPVVIEVKTNRDQNVCLHWELQEKVQETIDGMIK